MAIIVAEIGINHNGDVELAKDMIRVAKVAGCDYVKFQKRTVEKVYAEEALNQPRESPWGQTNRDQKNGLEFGECEYNSIALFCKTLGIGWFASPWDVDSVDFLLKYHPPYTKVASACVTDLKLLNYIKGTGVPVILSTGMSTRGEIIEAVELLGDNLEYILACTSTYPTKPDEINLDFIATLKRTFKKHRIGFSNHNPGLTFCIAAVALGAEMIEFHITLDRAMYGSDQAASIETPGVFSLVKHIRNVEVGMGYGEWIVYLSEEKIRQKLRR